MRIIACIIGGVALLGILWIGVLPVFYSYFPEYFGHYRFYTTCKSLKPGMTLAEARTAMATFLEVDRSWKPSDELPAGLMTATAMGVPENAVQHNSRILFIPDAKNFADWCIVYPEGGKIVRVDISPD
jgi:hypothetical protein